MTDIMPDATAGANLSLVQGLRDLADFIEAHPELPQLHGYVHGWVEDREALKQFAAIVPNPSEEVRYGSVCIEARFNDRARIEVTASIRAVDGREVTPQYDYEPIIGERS